MEYIELLLKIVTEIRKCYKELVEIEVSGENKDKITNIYDRICQYRILENEYLNRLKKENNSSTRKEQLIKDIMNYYDVISMSPIDTYILDLDHHIEIKRILERIDTELLPEDDFINTTLYYDEDDNITFELMSSFELSPDSKNQNVQTVLSPLMEEEDNIRFLDKLDQQVILNTEDIGMKKRLIQLKYDMYFLNYQLEGLLVEERCCPSLAMFDAKMRASYITNFTDEDIDKNYDDLRNYLILNLAEELSQRKNQGAKEDVVFRNFIRYMTIDIYAESISDEYLAETMGNLEDRIENSYSDDIGQARRTVYDVLYKKYLERIEYYEIDINDVDLEDDKEEISNQIEKNKAVIKQR